MLRIYEMVFLKMNYRKDRIILTLYTMLFLLNLQMVSNNTGLYEFDIYCTVILNFHEHAHHQTTTLIMEQYGQVTSNADTAI